MPYLPHSSSRSAAGLLILRVTTCNGSGISRKLKSPMCCTTDRMEGEGARPRGIGDSFKPLSSTSRPLKGTQPLLRLARPQAPGAWRQLGWCAGRV